MIILAISFISSDIIDTQLSPSSSGKIEIPAGGWTLKNIKNLDEKILAGEEAKRYLIEKFSESLDEEYNVKRIRDIQTKSLFDNLVILPDSDGTPKFLTTLDEVNSNVPSLR